MQQLHYIMGLPRTCSTVLSRILCENPRVFVTNTCPTPYLIHHSNNAIRDGAEFRAMDMNLMNKCYNNFLYKGLKAWFETLTDKPIVISKSRMWMSYLPYAFNFDKKSKYIIIVRDLRDIFCSYEGVVWKHTHLPQEHHTKALEKRFDAMTDYNSGSKLGPWLMRLPRIIELIFKNQDKFFVMKQEQFTNNPNEVIRDLYKFIDEENFTHDLNNIPDAPYLENDNAYQQPITHDVRKKLEKLQPRWPDKLTEHESEYVLNKFEWYYKVFYPEVLKSNVN